MKGATEEKLYAMMRRADREMMVLAIISALVVIGRILL